MRSITSSKDQFAQTPSYVLEQISEMYADGYGMYDPCPVNPKKDGLKGKWRGEVCFVNPPYTNCAAWVKKSTQQVQQGYVKRVVMLIPMRATTNWYHDLVVLNPYCHEIVFIRQGIRFINSKTGKEYCKKTPFPLCLAIFEGKPRKGSAALTSMNFYENVA